MLARAWDKMTKKYGFVPETPVGIELYPNREHFAVRTSGLPQTFIQGVCFGRTLAAMSPKDEHFNIGMTLWHELAHVFHIQLSKSHVPRWFTEGLAEYETLVERPEWRREYDADLYEALERGTLPQVADMNRSFSHAEDMQDMATAYYASTQVVGFIVERYGMPKVRRMLELWGQGKTTKDVLVQALGASPVDIDRDFRAMLSTRLARYRGQFMPPNRPRDVKAAETIAEAAPGDAEKQAELALAWLGAGEEKKAKAAIDRALSIDPKLGLALWLRLQFAKTGNDRAAAKRAAEAMIAAGHDGYAVRVALAEATTAKDEQRAALEAAHEFDPLQAAPLHRLAELARDAKDADGELKALRALVVLEENDGDSYRRLLTLLIGRHELEEARKVGEAAVYVDAESAETHRLYGEALLAAGQRKEAEFEFESAVLGQGSPAELSASHARLAELLESSGDKAAAAPHRKAAAELLRTARTGPI
jgi:tetratricopeptide (TPR) repeat protein